MTRDQSPPVLPALIAVSRRRGFVVAVCLCGTGTIKSADMSKAVVIGTDSAAVQLALRILDDCCADAYQHHQHRPATREELLAAPAELHGGAPILMVGGRGAA
jgi:hypothetical protein